MRLPSSRRFFLVAAAFFLAAPPVARAQQLPVPAGSRVRVRATQAVAPIIGSFQTIRNDTLVVLEDGFGGSLWTLPVPTVTVLEISAGMRRGDRGRATTMGLVGAGAGVLVGLIAAGVLENSTGDVYNKGASALVGGAVGGAIGATLGYRRRYEAWAPITMPRRAGAAAPR